MNTRLTRLVLASVIALSALGVGTLVSGHVGDCNETSIRLYEGLNLTGDSKLFCGQTPDLNNASHTQSGNCDDRFGLYGNDWDDCASSWAMGQNDHGYCVQIFSNPTGPLEFPLLEGGFYQPGQWSNFDLDENNKASSIKWTSTSVCGSNP
jgi:hypothetical protein